MAEGNLMQKEQQRLEMSKILPAGRDPKQRNQQNSVVRKKKEAGGVGLGKIANSNDIRDLEDNFKKVKFAPAQIGCPTRTVVWFNDEVDCSRNMYEKNLTNSILGSRNPDFQILNLKVCE